MQTAKQLLGDFVSTYCAYNNKSTCHYQDHYRVNIPCVCVSLKSRRKIKRRNPQVIALRNFRMENLLGDEWDVKSKHATADMLRRWRDRCSLVKNPKRRFRFTANLDKRDQAAAIRKNIQVSSYPIFSNTNTNTNTNICFHITTCIFLSLFLFIYLLFPLP